MSAASERPSASPGTAGPRREPAPDASDPAKLDPVDHRRAGSDEAATLDPRSLLRRLRVVAITDRRLMVDAATLAGPWLDVARVFGEAVARAVDGCPAGSVVVQIREKDLDGGLLLQLVRAAQPFAPIIVNDRIDVALAAAAAGIHLPERGISVSDARRLAPSLLLGVSRHATPHPRGPDAPDAGGDASPQGTEPDVVQLGPIWTTPSKPSVAALGLDALAWPHASACLVAVGGIDDPARATAAASAGADAIAAIRAAWTGASLAPFVAAVEAGRSRRLL